MNNIVRFIKKKNFIGYTDNGKVILSRNNDATIGYYQLRNIEEKENVIIADTERIVYDYFPNIDYNEFLNALNYNGFKIGFIEDFHYPSNVSTAVDHLIFAYDMETHMVIVAETINSGRDFNRIECYCPGMNFFNVKSRMAIYGNSEKTVFSLLREDIFNKNEGIIHNLKNNMKHIVKAGENIYKDDICLFNAAENKNIDFEAIRKKIKFANREDMIKIFEKSAVMLKALNS